MEGDTSKNITVKKLDSNDDVSTFYISIKSSVKAHVHKEHTEIVQVVSGKAQMRLGEKTFTIAAGDYVFIPKNTVHAVEVISKEPLVVLSVQTPKFVGKDRHFIND